MVTVPQAAVSGQPRYGNAMPWRTQLLFAPFRHGAVPSAARILVSTGTV